MGNASSYCGYSHLWAQYVPMIFFASGTRLFEKIIIFARLIFYANQTLQDNRFFVFVVFMVCIDSKDEITLNNK